MPAAAVIPTPRVCVRDAAVKESVVVAGQRGHGARRPAVEEQTGGTEYQGER